MPRLLLLLFFALAPACTGEGGGGPEAGPEEGEVTRVDPRTFVEVQPLARGEVADVLVSNGVVESVSEARLTPGASGTVVSILVEEGDRVRRGQVLAVIENATLDAALARATEQLSSAEAELARSQSLHARGAISDAELSQAMGAVQAAQTSAEEARRGKGSTRLVSPIDGTVATRALRYGELAGAAEAFTIMDLDHLRVVVQLPERDLPRLRVGQTARLRSVYDREHEVVAQVERISPVVDPQAGTFSVTIALPEGERTLRPGQFVSVRVEVERREDTLVVPRAAVVYEEGEPMVFVLRVEEPPVEEEAEGEGGEARAPGGRGGRGGRPGGFGGGRGGGGGGARTEKLRPADVPGPYRVARRVPVELGFVNDDLAELVGGVEEGAEIVVIGQTNLRDGAWVRVEGDPTLEDIEPAEPTPEDAPPAE